MTITNVMLGSVGSLTSNASWDFFSSLETVVIPLGAIRHHFLLVLNVYARKLVARCKVDVEFFDTVKTLDVFSDYTLRRLLGMVLGREKSQPEKEGIAFPTLMDAFKDVFGPATALKE